MANEYQGTSPDEKSGRGKADNADIAKRTSAKRKGGRNIRRSDGRVIRLVDKNTEAPADIQGVMPDDTVFALDIGTRTVAGVVGRQEGDHFHILATEVCEHKSRAMLDGQIHDIDQAAATVMDVKQRLEARLGFKLKRVAIAAAGRVLKTCRVKVEKSLEHDREIDSDFVSSLEIEAIQRAQMILDESSEAEDKTSITVLDTVLSIIISTGMSYRNSRATGEEWPVLNCWLHSCP